MTRRRLASCLLVGQLALWGCQAAPQGPAPAVPEAPVAAAPPVEAALSRVSADAPMPSFADANDPTPIEDLALAGWSTPSPPDVERPKTPGKLARVVEREPVVTKPSWVAQRYKPATGHRAAPYKLSAAYGLDDETAMTMTVEALHRTARGHYQAIVDAGDDGTYRPLGQVRFHATRQDPNNPGAWTLAMRVGAHTRRFFFDSRLRLVAIGLGPAPAAEIMYVDPEEVLGQRFTGALYPDGTDARLYYFLDDKRQIAEIFLGRAPGQEGVLAMSFLDPRLGYVHLQRLSR
jgi:hypothetical protein